MARLKADRFRHYRNNHQRIRRNTRRICAANYATTGIALTSDPSGVWWNHVHMFLAQRDDDLEAVARPKPKTQNGRSLC